MLSRHQDIVHLILHTSQELTEPGPDILGYSYGGTYGYFGYLEGTQGYLGILSGVTQWYLGIIRDTPILGGSLWGTLGYLRDILKGY